MAPELEPKKSSAGLILGLAGSAVGGFQQAKEFKAAKIGNQTAVNDAVSERIMSTDSMLGMDTAGLVERDTNIYGNTFPAGAF